MEYERIHKVQMGVMSPTKLRMRLLGSSQAASKSPSRLDAGDGDDADHPKNSLLVQELDEEYPKERSRSDASHGRAGGHAGSTGNGYDSGGGGNFEFHREERAAVAVVGFGPFFRQVPSKWNDAEKWIAGRHVVHSNPIFSKKASAVHGQNGGGGVRVAPEYVAPPSSDAKKSGGGGSSDNLASRSAVASALTELSSPLPSSSPLSSVTGPVSKQPPRHKKLRASESAPPAQSSVSMKDVGTEMTPITSQEQSRSGTPAGAATPSLSPLCSVPASPSASEKELRIRTRREIAALGLQLGKMSIASWASKEDLVHASPETSAGGEDKAKKEKFEARAAAWEESQQCKLASRYQRKEVKIQEWESSQRSKLEAEMRHAEAQAEQMKNRLTKRLSTLSHEVKRKQARVEARRNRRATRLALQVERIRKTGRVPPRFRCCSWFL